MPEDSPPRDDSDDPPSQNDPLMVVHSTETPVFTENNNGSKWFALLIIGVFVISGVLGLMVTAGVL